jgi:hypothetical protein
MSKLVEAAAEFLSRDTSTKQSRLENGLMLTQEEFDNLSEGDQEEYLYSLEQLDEVYSTMSRLKRKFIPGQGQKQAGERAKDQRYSAGLDRAALKYHPDDKKLATTMKSSEKAQKRYERISRGEAPFKSSPND